MAPNIKFITWTAIILLATDVHCLIRPGSVFKYSNEAPESSDAIQLIDRSAANRVKRAASDPTPKTITDNHDYYTKRVAIMHEESKFLTREFDRIFTTYSAGSHVRINNGSRLALYVPIKFSFDFYGHTVNHIVVTTGGYLYINNITHRQLGFSQYIAPLQADFNTYHPASRVKFIDAEDSFWVRWENMQLNANSSFGNFSFQCAIFKNGSIVFDYISVPKNLSALAKTLRYTMRAGISDAFYVDTRISATRVRRLITRYHAVDIDLSLIRDETIVNFTHLTTCNQLSSCDRCLDRSLAKNFNCSWCFEIKKCSSGVDRQYQLWRGSGCHLASDNTCREPAQMGVGVVVLAVVIILLIAAVATIVVFAVIAYRNPTSPAGRWLIEHRPSQLRSRLANVRFFKSSSSSGSAEDNYRVDVDHTYANMDA